MGLRMVATLAVVVLIGCGDAVDQPDDQAISTPVTTLEETPADTAGTTPQVSDTITSPPTGTGSPASEAPTELRVGDQGPQVEALQRRLVRLGFTIDADGHFGPATEAAVRSVQFTHGLTVDGIVGPRTTVVIDAAEPGAMLILAADGVGAVDFGVPAAGALPALTSGLGEPADDVTGPMNYPCGDTTCAGRERVVAWTGPVAGSLFGSTTPETASSSRDGSSPAHHLEASTWQRQKGFEWARAAYGYRRRIPTLCSVSTLNRAVETRGGRQVNSGSVAKRPTPSTGPGCAGRSVGSMTAPVLRFTKP